MGAKFILCLKLLENMTYIRGLQTFFDTGPPKSWTRLCLSSSFKKHRVSDMNSVHDRIELVHDKYVRTQGGIDNGNPGYVKGVG